MDTKDIVEELRINSDAEPNLVNLIEDKLKELEEYQIKEFQCHLAQQEGISIGYEKALNDYVDELYKHEQKNWIDHLEYGITFEDIEEVKEKLLNKKCKPKKSRMVE